MIQNAQLLVQGDAAIMDGPEIAARSSIYVSSLKAEASTEV